MKARLSRIGDMKFVARAGDSPPILLHAPARGEVAEAPSPMQAALLAAMGCTASDVVWILGKQRASIASLEIEAEAERAPEDPKVFTKVHLHFRIRGAGLTDDAVRRAIDLSTEKYCSVGIMLRRAGVEWTTSAEILPDG